MREGFWGITAAFAGIVALGAMTACQQAAVQERAASLPTTQVATTQAVSATGLDGLEPQGYFPKPIDREMDGPMHLLFVGNSLTYQPNNYIPDKLQAMAKASGQQFVHAERKVIGGRGLPVHLETGLGSVIQAGDYDMVVLQYTWDKQTLCAALVALG